MLSQGPSSYSFPSPTFPSPTFPQTSFMETPSQSHPLYLHSSAFSQSTFYHLGFFSAHELHVTLLEPKITTSQTEKERKPLVFCVSLGLKIEAGFFLLLPTLSGAWRGQVAETSTGSMVGAGSISSLRSQLVLMSSRRSTSRWGHTDA